MLSVSDDAILGWAAYTVGLIWYLAVCAMAGQLFGGQMQWIMPLVGFVGWTMAALVVRWRLR
jgi:hypothetical protein